MLALLTCSDESCSEASPADGDSDCRPVACIGCNCVQVIASKVVLTEKILESRCYDLLPSSDIGSFIRVHRLIVGSVRSSISDEGSRRTCHIRGLVAVAVLRLAATREKQEQRHSRRG